MSVRKFFQNVFGKRQTEKSSFEDIASMDADDLTDSLHLLTGEAERPAHMPSWAMSIHPGVNYQTSSWLGGRPFAPRNFEWPCDPDGSPMHFIGQFDLGGLGTALEGNEDLPNLPKGGAMLVFIRRGYAVKFVSVEELADAEELIEPPNISKLSEIDFSTESAAFTKVAVNLVPFDDDGKNAPDNLLPIPSSPQEWITNWGTITLAASSILQWWKKTTYFDFRKVVNVEPKHTVPTDTDVLEIARLVKIHGSVGITWGDEVTQVITEELLSEREWLLEKERRRQDLERFRDQAATQSPFATVSAEAFQEFLNLVSERADRLKPYAIEDFMVNTSVSLQTGEDAASVPEEMLPYLQDFAPGWRRHRILGKPDPDYILFEDLRGYDCLVAIYGDAFLGNRAEHSHSISIWCPRDDMASGNFSTGKLVRHSNG